MRVPFNLKWPKRQDDFKVKKKVLVVGNFVCVGYRRNTIEPCKHVKKHLKMFNLSYSFKNMNAIISNRKYPE